METTIIIKPPKKVINFWCKMLPFPKKWSNASSEQSFSVSSENTAFSKKIVKSENIYHLIYD